MRVRDLRWYILASIILIISYAAIAFCCYLPVRGRAESSMKTLGLEASIQEAKLVQDQVNTYYDEFYVREDWDGFDPVTGLPIMDFGHREDTAPEFTTVGMKPTTVKDGVSFVEEKVSDSYSRYIAFGDENFVSQNSSSMTNGDFFYFIKHAPDSKYANSEGYVVARIKVQDVFTDSRFDLFFFAGSGMNYYTNTDSEQALIDIQKIASSLEYDGNGNFCDIYDVLGKTGVLSGTPFYGGYISTFIEIDAPYLAIDWVLSQTLTFYIIGIFLILVMLGIFIFGVRKCSKLLRTDRHALQATKAIVIRIDTNGKVIFTNKTFKQIFGIQEKLLNVNEFIDVDTNEPILNTIKQNRAFECSVPIGYDDVKYFHLSPLHISSSYYLMGTEITIDYLRRKHLELMSGKNDITGCDNGFTLTNQFNHILLNATAYDLAFVEYNIHKYEEIVAVFGRNNYHLLLNEFLTILQETYKELSIYHINDAKFMVVYPNNGMDEVLENIRHTLDVLRRPFQIKQNHIYVKCKIVVYDLNKNDFEGITLEHIKDKLELAYRNVAEFSTKDYIVYEPAMDRVILAADEMEKDLENGLINREFRMHLQPQYDVVNNRVAGFEALIRWHNPKYKDKSPQTYIELAEQRGYMLDIGRFVITETFKLAKKLEPYKVHISMNVSPIQLLQVGFTQQLVDEFKALRLKPGSIAIEITETFLMGNFQLVNEKLKLLKDMGFHIHLDDFCTGYSSMLYLKDLPVDTIKIDKEFTKFIENNKVHENIVRTICTLGANLNLDVICEGVETQIQSDMVKKMGCKIIQGWLIGKAMPLDEAIELLERYNAPKR